MEIGCIVKAAGKSRRFGSEDKLLALLGGKPLLRYVLDALPNEIECPNVGTVPVGTYVVVSSDGTERLCEAIGVRTLRYGGGPVSETIRVGLSAALGTDGCMFVSGDQPLCERESYIKVLSAFLQNPDRVVRLSFGGVAGSPVVFPKRLYPRLMSLNGERGGMSVAGGEEPLLVEAKSGAEMIDVDSREDIVYLESCLRNT